MDINQGSSSSWRPCKRSEDFQEEDVWNHWNVIKEDQKVGFKIDEQKAPSSPLSISRRLPSADKMIPRTEKQQDYDNDDPELVQHSAPVRIPDWSKIYGKNPKTKDGSSSDGAEESDEDWDDDAERSHSHEWLAKKFARNQISSFSVCEGAGRTLKGRDLSRVRNAVLSKTGFI